MAVAFAAGLLGAQGVVAAPILTELSDFEPPGDIRWRAGFRVGDASTGSASELLLGDPGSLPFLARGDFPWIPGMTEAFTLAYDGTNVVEMTVGGVSISLELDSEDPPIPTDSTELLLRVIANSQRTTGVADPPVEFVEVVVSDLVLEGMPVGVGLMELNVDPCAGVDPGGFPGMNCNAQREFLRIGGPDLLDGFVLSGNVELDWGDGEMPLFSRLRFDVDGFVPDEPLTPPDDGPTSIAEPASVAICVTAWAGMLIVGGRRQPRR